jgi:hypothetical protein
VKRIVILALLPVLLQGCDRGRPSTDLVRQLIIENYRPGPTRKLHISNIKYRCKITRGPNGKRIKVPMYGYTYNVKFHAAGYKPHNKNGEKALIFKKNSGDKWILTTLVGWNC